MENTFLAMLFRMKHINRWGLMYNTQTENLSQHTAECAFLVHFLAVVGNTVFNKNYDADKLAAYALFHDVSEVLTGDLPTPVKYFNNDIKTIYKQVEKTASEKLLSHLPNDLQASFSPYLYAENLSENEKKLLKIADKLCAFLKCISELNAGNQEFQAAYSSIKNELENTENDELEYFMKNCLNAFTLSIDELKGTL